MLTEPVKYDSKNREFIISQRQVEIMIKGLENIEELEMHEYSDKIEELMAESKNNPYALTTFINYLN